MRTETLTYLLAGAEASEFPSLPPTVGAAGRGKMNPRAPTKIELETGQRRNWGIGCEEKQPRIDFSFFSFFQEAIAVNYNHLFHVPGNHPIQLNQRLRIDASDTLYIFLCLRRRGNPRAQRGQPTKTNHTTRCGARVAVRAPHPFSRHATRKPCLPFRRYHT